MLGRQLYNEAEETNTGSLCGLAALIGRNGVGIAALSLECEGRNEAAAGARNMGVVRGAARRAHPLLGDDVLVGVGSGGPGFNTYRPDELSRISQTGSVRRASLGAGIWGEFARSALLGTRGRRWRTSGIV